MHGGQTTTIYLLTDGPDDLLSRRQRRGRVNLACEGDEVASFTVAGMRNGRIAVHVHIPNTVPSGRRAGIVATLEVEPATFLTDSRELRIVPPPPPYVGTEPPSQFDFARSTSLLVEVGRKASAEIHTDARNDILDRPVDPAWTQAACDVPGVYVAIRGPRDGVASAEIHAGSGAVPETEGTVTVNLNLRDGTTLSTARPFKIVPARERRPRSGVQTIQVPAYEVFRVWRSAPEDSPEALTWSRLPGLWNEERVGHWEMNRDQLYLYVNMDERQFQAERLRLNRRFDESRAQRLADRHVAYLAFHMFQLYEQSRRETHIESNRNLATLRTTKKEPLAIPTP